MSRQKLVRLRQSELETIFRLMSSRKKYESIRLKIGRYMNTPAKELEEIEKDRFTNGQ